MEGFTLIEIIVSMGLFLVVAVVALGALLKIIDENKKAHNIKTAITNLNFALESMTREIRLGTNYFCKQYSIGQIPNTDAAFSSADEKCPDGLSAPPLSDWAFAFKSSHTYPFEPSKPNSPVCHLIYAYKFIKYSLLKAEQTECDGSLDQNIYPIISGPCDTLACEGKKQDALINFTKGSISLVDNGTQQPYVRIHFTGYVGDKEKVKAPFDFQTSISQRLSQ